VRTLEKLGCLGFVKKSTDCLMTPGLARLENLRTWGCWKVGMCGIKIIRGSLVVGKYISY